MSNQDAGIDQSPQFLLRDAEFAKYLDVVLALKCRSASWSKALG